MIVMLTGTPLSIMVSLVSGQVVPGFVDGLVLNIRTPYTFDELKLLSARIQQLGIITDFTQLQRRGSRTTYRLVIPNEHLAAARTTLAPYMLPEFMHLFDRATSENSVR